MPSLESAVIGVVGLGYVGLPLALAFGKHFSTVGYDIDASRLAELRASVDGNGESQPYEFGEATGLSFVDDPNGMRDCNVYIVTVPTPVDADKRPDFGPLVAASRMIGALLKVGDTVIYESTVYPGATEEICVPHLEASSGKVFNVDFHVGYSPERINPGDTARKLTDIRKVTSGSSPEAADFVDALYKRIISAGTHRASSLKVAEASKVIENTQRDANIALVNEFALIFHRLGIDTAEVLQAASTKWNFLPFQPGLVGGHCIGVDPYYLIQRAQAAGYYPDILLACRRINDSMGVYIASEVVKLMVRAGCRLPASRILILGITFKENCADLRNTRVVELAKEFGEYGAAVDFFDPIADAHQARAAYGVELLTDAPRANTYDAVVLAVPHREFVQLGANTVRAYGKPGSILYDIKSVFPRELVDARL